MPATGTQFDYRGFKVRRSCVGSKGERPCLMNRQCFRDLRGQDEGSVGKLQ